MTPIFRRARNGMRRANEERRLRFLIPSLSIDCKSMPASALAVGTASPSRPRLILRGSRTEFLGALRDAHGSGTWVRNYYEVQGGSADLMRPGPSAQTNLDRNIPSLRKGVWK